MRRSNISTRSLITVTTLVSCFIIWWQGLINSPVGDPGRLEQIKLANISARNNDPALQAERALAEAYWLRYPDIRMHAVFGSNGTMGIFGPRTHYEQHGENEKRIFAAIAVSDDPGRERELAEAYWKRYPQIERSAIWGSRSRLGIRGPWDHYIFLGKEAGFRWGVEANDTAPSP